MNNEDQIHQLYKKLQQVHSARTGPILDPIGGVAIPTNKYSPSAEIPRWNYPSFRAQFFDTSEGLMTLAPGETKVLASLVVPIGHLGVMTGFTQYFADCDEIFPSIANSITWGIRINGTPPRNFPDFVGELSKPYLPRPVFFPLLGEIGGSVSISPGGFPTSQTPSASLQATNLLNRAAILVGRIIGYTFPIDERNDEFGAY